MKVNNTIRPLPSLTIGDRKIGEKHPPFIVAEMSGNHNQSLQRALKIVDEAARCGCDAVKLQTYTPDTLTIDCPKRDFFIRDRQSLWYGYSLYALYSKAHTPWEWHRPIFKRCREKNLICFSTPFDETAVDFLESLNVPAYKIASFENTHLPLIKKVAKTGKPVIISTGLATLAELQATVATIRRAGCNSPVLLKCTSAYPAVPAQANLRTIPDLAARFHCHVGLSDHTSGIGVAIASVVLGARIIEKHFTLSRAEGGVDAAFSIQPAEMKLLTEECRRAFVALGKVSYSLTKEEAKNLLLKRSLFVVNDMQRGEIFDMENVRVIRPNGGLAPQYFPGILGQRAACNIKRGTPLGWQHIQRESS